MQGCLFLEANEATVSRFWVPIFFHFVRVFWASASKKGPQRFGARETILLQDLLDFE